MEPAMLAALFAAGGMAGAVNAAAGGGTFFSFPALIWAGLPPLVANATNMVALLPANFAALPAFRKELRSLGRATLIPVLQGIAGGLIGAILLLYLGNAAFARAVPWLMGAATLLFATAPALRRLIVRFSPARVAGTGALLPLFSVYGGYFGAGLGQITLAALILDGHTDMARANALKNAVVGMVSLVAVIVFSAGAAIAWAPAAAMAAGAALGGYLGGLLARIIPERALRWGITGFGVLLTAIYALRGV